MKLVSPKYIPREWILVSAYDSLNNGDDSILKELQKLFKSPYEEQIEFEEKYYRKAKLEIIEGRVGGVSYMT